MTFHYRSCAFVVKKRDSGEADRVFTLFSEDFGRIEILGKAIRKITSKLRGGIEPIALSEIEFIQGKARKTLTDVVILERFKNIKNDLIKLRIAHKIAEAVDKLVGGEEKDEHLWGLITEVFETLNNYPLPTTHYSLIYYYFLWNFFSILGYQPELYKCAVCQRKLTPGFLYFSPSEGGVVCSKCTKIKKRMVRQAHHPEQGRRTNTDVVKIIRLILKKDWLMLSKLKIPPFSKKLLSDVSKDYYNYLLSIHMSKEGLEKE